MNSSFQKRSQQKGQVIIEYVLLLVIAVSLAALITKELVSREDGNEGALVLKWQSLLKVIGDDLPDDPKK